MPRRAKGQPEFPNRVMVEEDLDSERECMLSGREGREGGCWSFVQDLMNLHLRKWFNFKFEVIYFYNVYGPNQICKGKIKEKTEITITETTIRRKIKVVMLKCRNL